MIEPHVRWMAPSPLWSEARVAGDTAALQQPTLLRFATDSFMDEFFGMLEADPARLGELRAMPETWRGPTPRPKPVQPLPAFQRALSRRQLADRAGGNGVALAKHPLQASAASPHLKLYQPAHQRFYLLAANLVCRMPGFPDRALDPARPEKTSFVLRRLRAPNNPTDPSTHHLPADCVEYAFVTRNHQTGWQRVNALPGVGSDVLVAGEEELPLSGVTFNEDDGRKRRLLIGFVPVGRREAYIGAPEISTVGDVIQPPRGPGDPPAPNPRLYPLQVQITGPWVNLIDQATAAGAARAKAKGAQPNPFSSAGDGDLLSVIRTARNNIQTGSWYALLDLANYLDVHINPVWQAITGKAVSLDQATQQPLYDKLSNTALTAGQANALLTTDSGATSVPKSLAEALVKARAAEQDLEGVTIPFAAGPRAAPSPPANPPQWPTFLFPLADPIESISTGTRAWVNDLETLIDKALPAQLTGPVPAPQEVIQPALDPRGNDWFVLRCVFERPNCDPITPPLVSAPCPAFELAGFFDPDAPARPIRIGLPIDISPAGLRKTNKNTVFVLSDLLCGQVKRAQGMTLGDLVLSVLPWPFHKDLPGGDTAGPCRPDGGGPSFGMICSLSIPIITICALILLIIMVSLFDIIFHWLPYFIICFPFPRFRAKESS
jgi:hypothetical protein